MSLIITDEMDSSNDPYLLSVLVLPKHGPTCICNALSFDHENTVTCVATDVT